jgi:uncharacterized membrane protein (UPF0136 family)
VPIVPSAKFAVSANFAILESMRVPAIISFVFGTLVLLGGVYGFVSKGSMPSLMAGVVCELLLCVAGFGFLKGQRWALPLAVVVGLLLLGRFAPGIGSDDASKRTLGITMTAISALSLVGLLATGTRKQ